MLGRACLFSPTEFRNLLRKPHNLKKPERAHAKMHHRRVGAIMAAEVDKSMRLVRAYGLNRFIPSGMA